MSIKKKYGKTDFLEMRDGSVKLKTSHKYYSQVTMLIAIAQARQTYFVLWTTKHLLIEKIEFSAEHWNKQHSTAVVFFSGVMCCRFL